MLMFNTIFNVRGNRSIQTKSLLCSKSLTNRTYVVIFPVFSDFRSEVIGRFVDIDGTVDRHRLNLLFISKSQNVASRTPHHVRGNELTTLMMIDIDYIGR